MLGPDGDFIRWCPHRLPVLPFLLVGDQPSLVQDDVNDDVVKSVDLPARVFQQLTMCLVLSDNVMKQKIKCKLKILITSM